MAARRWLPMLNQLLFVFILAMAALVLYQSFSGDSSPFDDPEDDRNSYLDVHEKSRRGAEKEGNFALRAPPMPPSPPLVAPHSPPLAPPSPPLPPQAARHLKKKSRHDDVKEKMVDKLKDYVDGKHHVINDETSLDSRRKTSKTEEKLQETNVVVDEQRTRLEKQRHEFKSLQEMYDALDPDGQEADLLYLGNAPHWDLFKPYEMKETKVQRVWIYGLDSNYQR